MELAEAQNKQLLASYSTRIENAKLTNKNLATELVRFMELNCYYQCVSLKSFVMINGERQEVTQKAVRWPCGVCGRGVGNNSIQCTILVRSGYTGTVLVQRVPCTK